MDRENITPENEMKSGAAKTAASIVAKQELLNTGSGDDDYEEWKEGYLAEIYLSGNIKDQP